MPKRKGTFDSLDAEAILAEYAEVFGKVEAEAERTRCLPHGRDRLQILDSILTNEHWIQEDRLAKGLPARTLPPRAERKLSAEEAELKARLMAL